MILTIVDRFKSIGDVLNLKKSQLYYFYDGATELNDADKRAIDNSKGKK